MKKYFLHNGRKQTGPFDLEELKREDITSETYIWHEGLPGWIKASTLDALKSIFTSTPIPFSYDITPPPFLENVSDQGIAGFPRLTQTRKPVLVAVFASAVIAIAGAMFVFVQHKVENTVQPGREHENAKTIEENEKERPVDFLTIQGTVNSNKLGTRLKIKGMVTNKATKTTYKDLTVKILIYNKSNDLINSSDHKLEEVFPPSTTTAFDLKTENFKNVANISFEVLKANPE